MPIDPDDPRFKKGGRKGYEFEKAQLDKMRKILDKDLEIIEKWQDAKKINPTDREKLQISQARVMKIMDKLHASRTALEGSDGNPLIIQISQEIAQKNDINISTVNDSTGLP